MRSRFAIGLLVLVLTGRTAVAEPLPSKNQALLLLRILAYDHKLAERVESKRVTIYVVHKSATAESEDPANEMVGVLREIAKSTKLAGNAIQIVKIAYNKDSIDGDLGKVKGAAVYVAPNLGDSLGPIMAATAKRKLLSFTGVVEYVNAGISVGFSNANGKPVISINLPASKNEGADLDVALLRVAKIVKK
ncbi:MAG TPA: YfiR family protein [Kofleriaceae bacterium]